MDLHFLIGIIGSLVLITGAAYPIRPASHPAKSAKNWLFAIGSACMFAYAIMGYLAGGSIFFVFLQVLIAISTVLMMFNTPDTYDTPIIAVAGIVLTAWSLTIFEGIGTVLFVAGLATLGLGFAFNMGTFRRNAALAIGSVLVAIFSYLMADWIFFWLNAFFALFSGYYAVKLFKKPIL